MVERTLSSESEALGSCPSPCAVQSCDHWKPLLWACFPRSFLVWTFEDYITHDGVRNTHISDYNDGNSEGVDTMFQGMDRFLPTCLSGWGPCQPRRIQKVLRNGVLIFKQTPVPSSLFPSPLLPPATLSPSFFPFFLLSSFLPFFLIQRHKGIF